MGTDEMDGLADYFRRHRPIPVAWFDWVALHFGAAGWLDCRTSLFDVPGRAKQPEITERSK